MQHRDARSGHGFLQYLSKCVKVRVGLGGGVNVFGAAVGAFKHKLDVAQLQQRGQFAVQRGRRSNALQLHGIGHGEGFALCVVQADHLKQFLRSQVNLGIDLMAAQNFFEVQEANEGGFHKSDIYKSYSDCIDSWRAVLRQTLEIKPLSYQSTVSCPA